MSPGKRRLGVTVVAGGSAWVYTGAFERDAADGRATSVVFDAGLARVLAGTFAETPNRV